MIPRIHATEAIHNDRRDWRNLRGMLPYLWEFRGRALFALGCLVLAKLANVGVPLVLKDIVDAFENANAQMLVLPGSLLLAYGALKLSGSLFNELRDVIFARVRFRAMRRLSTRVLEHLHRLSLRYHLERQSGAVSRDLERGTRSVSTILNYLVFSVIPVLVEFTLVALVLLTKYALVFTLVTFGTVAIYVAFTFAITEWRMDYRRQMNVLDSQANSQAFDSLLNYETVKYFGNEQMELDRYDNTLSEWEDMATKSQSSMSVLNFGQGSIIALGVTLIMFFAARGVVAGDMSIGDLVLVNAFMLQLFIPLGFLGIVYRQIKYALADMDLVFKLLEREPEIQDKPGAPALKLKRGAVRFERVGFHYQPEREILRDVDFAVEPGEKVAVVGHSGAGKSTLARLLFRSYDVTAGRILIDGQDIRDVAQQSLRAAIGIVPQDTVLFNDSIRYNLAYGRPGAGFEELERAAAQAHILTLAEVAEHHTTLAIAHRLSTIVDADRILVMDAGRVLEQGSHARLLADGGIYAAMWELQQREREEAGPSLPGRYADQTESIQT